MSSLSDGIKEDRESALIARIAEARDRKAFAQLFERFAPLIKAYLRRAGCIDGEAEELAQETMLTVWRKAEQFDGHKAPAAAWIFTIARNLRVDTLRRRPIGGLRFEPLNEEGTSPYDAVADRQSLNSLLSALSRLPAEQVEVIQAAYLEHRAHSEIAEMLDMPLGTVKSRLRLALRRLRAELESPQ